MHKIKLILSLIGLFIAIIGSTETQAVLSLEELAAVNKEAREQNIEAIREQVRISLQLKQFEAMGKEIRLPIGGRMVTVSEYRTALAKTLGERIELDGLIDSKIQKEIEEKHDEDVIRRSLEASTAKTERETRELKQEIEALYAAIRVIASIK